MITYLTEITHESPFIALLIILLLAAIVPVIVSRFKKLTVPIVVGEIVAGILLSVAGLKPALSEQPVLDFLAEFGLVFLMFLSGMEIDFSSLGISGSRANTSRKRQMSPIALALMSFAATLVMSAGVGWFMYRMDLVRNPIMMGLILSTTSLGVVVPVLKEQGLIGGRFGQTLLLAALVADFATMLLITIEVAVLSTGLTFEALLVLVLFVAFFFAYRFGVLFFNRIKAVRRVMEELSSATAQIKIRIAIALMLLFVALSELLGTEIILGSFLAGVIISLLRTPDDDHVIGQLETIGYGFFIPIFFIKVGVDLNFSALFSSSNALLVVPILLVAAFLIKILAGQVFRFSFSPKESIAGGILLSSRLSLIIAAVAIGTRLGVISESVNAAVIVVAVISVILSPLVFNRLIPRSERTARRIKLVAGDSELGLQVARQLREHNEEVIVISRDEMRAKKARQQGFEVVIGRLEEQDPAIEAYLEDADSLLVASSDEQLNYRICQAARTIYGVKNVITHVSDPQMVPSFRQMGVRTMNTVLDLASLLALLGRNPSIYDLLMSADDDKELIQIEIENELCFNRKLRDLVLPGDALVVSLRRNGDLLVPHGNTQLSRGDELTIVGSLDCINTARQLFQGPCE